VKKQQKLGGFDMQEIKEKTTVMRRKILFTEVHVARILLPAPDWCALHNST
jgi:hypothetical protein